MIKLLGIGDCLVGKVLIGQATKIEIHSVKHIITPNCTTNKKVILRKTRGRNSQCFINKQVAIAENISIREIDEAVKVFISDFHKGFIGTDNLENIGKVHHDTDSFLEGELIFGFSEDCDKPEFLPKMHGHNMQQVKKIRGNPAICYIERSIIESPKF